MSILIVKTATTDTEVLANLLSQAGLRLKDVTLEDAAWGQGTVSAAIQRERPNVVLALGDEAAQSVLPEWPDKSMLERRGYFFVGEGGQKVLGTFNPTREYRGAGGAINRMLLIYDIQRAKEEAGSRELQRPTREVEVVDTEEKADEASKAILAGACVGCDIEIRDEQTLLCVGFAASSRRAYVFTYPTFARAYDILRDHRVSKVFHNGAFDTYFLKTRCGVNVQGYTDDTIIRFHCCWPELAGQGSQGSKRTEKSLRFLASLYTKDKWWKDYDTDEAGMYYLNGLDCMITYDVEMQLREIMKELDIPERIYRHEMALVSPVVHILERGIRVDKLRLSDCLEGLLVKQESVNGRLAELARPVLEENRELVKRPNLFWKKRTCKGCRNGSKKKLTCEECGGVGQWEEFEFNPNSNDQKKILLYDLIGVPAKYHKGKPSVLEEKLKDLLGGLA